MTAFTELTWAGDAPQCRREGHQWRRVSADRLYKCARCGRLGFGPALNAPGVARHPIVSQRSAATTPGRKP